MKHLLTFILFLSYFSNYAQNLLSKDYNWEVNPNYQNFKINESEEIICFKDKLLSEFAYTDKGELLEYIIRHQIIWLNSDAQIEENNKVYLPYNNSSILLSNKARVITKSGKVIELDNSKILTATDQETNQTLKYYAFEGIEKGSFIEYFYTLARYPVYTGNKISIQKEYNKYNLQFDLYAPKNLIFKFKSYNGLPEVEEDTTSTDRLHWKLNKDYIEKLEKEVGAPYKAYVQSFVYKLDRNINNNNNDISSYASTAKNIHAFAFQELTKKEIASIEKLIKEANVNTSADDLAKIRTLENFIKKKFHITTQSGEDFTNINITTVKKIANESGLIKLYIACLKTLNIDTEIIITSNRFESKFDKEFESANFLDNYLLFFPSINQYTSVGDLSSRVGFPPAELTDNYGLFIKEVTIGNFKSGIGKIKYINASKAKESCSDMIIDVTFNPEDLTSTLINFEHQYSGYAAASFQPILEMLPTESVEKLYTELIQFVNKNLEIKTKSVINSSIDTFGIKPFIIVAETKSDAFVEKAGNKYLFKIGDLIGPQVQMYQEKSRKLPYESDYNRSYTRKINIKIPKGYKINNLSDINISNAYSKNGEKLFEFTSSYSIKNEILTVDIIEFYEKNMIPVEMFEEYRKVINSAADFNKIVLVLEKI